MSFELKYEMEKITKKHPAGMQGEQRFKTEAAALKQAAKLRETYGRYLTIWLCGADGCAIRKVR